MSKLSRWLRRDREYLHGAPETLWRTLIAQHARNHTFVDVGRMWKVDGTYAFHALASGATGVTGIDVDPATPAFDAMNATVANQVRFVRGDLNDPEIPSRLSAAT